MPNVPSGTAEQRGMLIKLLENAKGLAEDLAEGKTAYLIERALDELGHSNSGRSGIDTPLDRQVCTSDPR